MPWLMMKMRLRRALDGLDSWANVPREMHCKVLSGRRDANGCRWRREGIFVRLYFGQPRQRLALRGLHCLLIDGKRLATPP